MRSNGLTASSYAPVADLEPQLAASLLEQLKAQGVAAYTTPVESSTTAGFDRAEFRVQVLDRLYVDAAAAAKARELIGQQGADLLADNDDLAWAQLVAGFDRPYEGASPWPAEEELTQPPVPDEPQEAPRALRDPPNAHPGGMDDEDFVVSTSRSRAHPEDTASADRFVPPPPPPLPELAPYKKLAWLGLLGGPLLLLVGAFTHLDPPGWVLFFCVLGFVGGFVTLVATMDDQVDGDSGSGDGAVV